MKIEFLHQHQQRQHGARCSDRLVAHLPRYAPCRRARSRRCSNLRDRVPGLARAGREARPGIRRAPLAARVATAAPFRRRDRAAATAGAPARSCCSPTPSTRSSSPRTCARPSRVLAARRLSRHASRAARRRPAALLRPHVPRGRHGRRGARRGCAHARGARALRRARQSAASGSSRRACSGCATSSGRCSPAPRPSAVAARGAHVRGVPRARARGRALRAAAPPVPLREARSSTGTATRRRSARCRRRSRRR